MVIPRSVAITNVTTSTLPSTEAAGARRLAHEFKKGRRISALVSQYDLSALNRLGIHFLSENRARALPGHVNDFAEARIEKAAYIGRGIKDNVACRHERGALIKREMPMIAFGQLCVELRIRAREAEN